MITVKRTKNISVKQWENMVVNLREKFGDGCISIDINQWEGQNKVHTHFHLHPGLGFSGCCHQYSSWKALQDKYFEVMKN